MGLLPKKKMAKQRARPRARYPYISLPYSNHQASRIRVLPCLPWVRAWCADVPLVFVVALAGLEWVELAGLFFCGVFSIFVVAVCFYSTKVRQQYSFQHFGDGAPDSLVRMSSSY